MAASLVASHGALGVIHRRDDLIASHAGTLCLRLRPLVMGAGCVGCGLIVFISRCSEFGFVACVRVEANAPCGFANSVPTLVAQRASRTAFFCASHPESDVRKRRPGWRWACPGCEQSHQKCPRRRNGVQTSPDCFSVC